LSSTCFKLDDAALPPLNSSAMAVVVLVFKQVGDFGVESKGRSQQNFKDFAQVFNLFEQHPQASLSSPGF
jgi:hypothetical protein